MKGRRILRSASCAAALTILLMSSFIWHGCGEYLNQPVESGKKDEAVSLELVWPDGVKYDQGSARLDFASGEYQRTAPAYVTKITLFVSGEDMESQVIDVPVDTLSAKVTVTFGVRDFKLVVDTDIDTMFTGALKVNVGPGMAPVLRFELEINAPPVVEKVELSNEDPKLGEEITITAYAYDMDPEDVISYKWEVVEPSLPARNALSGSAVDGGTGRALLTFTGPSITFKIDRKGEYKITLRVEDDHGGVTEGSGTLEAINHPPLITSLTATNPNPYYNQSTTLNCSAEDPDGDPLFYKWVLGPGQIYDTGTSNTFAYTSMDAKSRDVICEVNDNYGGFDARHMMLNKNPYRVEVVWNASGPDVDLKIVVTDPLGNTWDSPADGGGQNCSSPSPVNGPDYVWLGGAPIAGDYFVDVMYVDDCGSVLGPANDINFVVKLLKDGAPIASNSSMFSYTVIPPSTQNDALTFAIP